MRTYDFVHLALLACGGEIEGRTKLQKTIYFLGASNGLEADLGYGPHYYGPYSSVVSDAVDRLVSVGFVEQRSTTYSEEMSRHDYWLTDDGKATAEKKAKRLPKTWRRIQHAVETLGPKLEKFGYQSLSVMAKLHYLWKNDSEMSLDAEVFQACAKRKNWKLTRREAERAIERLRDLNLIQS